MHNADLSPADRARALYHYFGWQGGTIHQLAAETGCQSETLLSGQLDGHESGLNSDNAGGWFAVRTCDTPWRVNRLAPKYRGNWPYWAGVISGFWATGPLDASGNQ